MEGGWGNWGRTRSIIYGEAVAKGKGVIKELATACQLRAACGLKCFLVRQASATWPSERSVHCTVTKIDGLFVKKDQGF